MCVNHESHRTRPSMGLFQWTGGDRGAQSTNPVLLVLSWVFRERDLGDRDVVPISMGP